MLNNTHRDQFQELLITAIMILEDSPFKTQAEVDQHWVGITPEITLRITVPLSH
jgi:hypothetical protein